MKKKDNNFIIEDKIFYTYFILSFLILIIIIIWNEIEIDIIIIRAKNIFSFWILIFLIIFLPRRFLQQSKNFKYIMLNIRKNYPIFFYYRISIFNLFEYIYFFFQYILFYFERIMKYFLVGTNIKWLNPYRSFSEKGEFIKQLILEFIMWLMYIIMYIFKVFYEIINFFDNANIYKIIKSRILGFFFITIGYLVIGNKFFIFYLISLVVIFIIYNIIIIYLEYKLRIKKNPKYNIVLNEVLVFYGYINKLIFLYLEIKNIQYNSFLCLKPFKIKRKNYILYAIKRKYGIKKATKCTLTINFLTDVVKYNEEYILRDFIDKNIIECDIIDISSYEFTTNFLKKKQWYENNDISLFKIHDCFNNAILGYNKNFINNLDFQIYFLKKMYSIFNNDLKDDNLIKEFFNFKVLEGFYEFKNILSFVNFIEKKILLEGGINKFNNKYYLDNGVGNKLENIFSISQDQTQNFLKEEIEFSYFLILYGLLKQLNYFINEEELKEIIEKKYKNLIKK